MADSQLETLDRQLDEISLIRAMYEPDEAVSMEEADEAVCAELKAWIESGNDRDKCPPPPAQSLTNVSLKLRLDVPDAESGEATGKSLELDLRFPMMVEADHHVSQQPLGVKVRVLQPAWMSKAEAARLSDSIPDNPEDTLATLEYIKDAASRYLSEATSRPTEATAGANATANASLTRVWFYFPSISTRSKRDDIVHYAPAYKLTGFLLAGKPGILCLEGDSQAIDDYMRFIKTESWGDIPSQHKKVSERYREMVGGSGGEEGGVGEGGDGGGRAFGDMSEITDVLGGERRGERANRNDMKALEAWLVKNGLGEAFNKILI